LRVDDRILRQQHGIVRHDQLGSLGISAAALRWRLERGHWRRLLPQVYATVTGQLTDRQRAIAAALYAGAAAQIAGISALRMHGLRYVPPSDGPVHVLIPHHRRRASVGRVRIHRTTRLDRFPWRNGVLVVCSPARAVADASRACPELRDVRAMTAEVVQRGMATVAQLKAELRQARRNGSALFRQAVIEVADGVRSAPEADLRAALRGSAILGRIRWNARLTTPDGRALPTPDGWIEDVGIALEADSVEYHTSPGDWARTLERHNRLTQHGALVLHFPPERIRRRRLDVRRMVESAYAARRSSGATCAVRVQSG
jgi:hypothetical protein